MNIKKATNTKLSKTESNKKNKPKEKKKQTTRTRTKPLSMEIIWRVISLEGKGKMEEKVQGLKSIIGRYKVGGC